MRSQDELALIAAIADDLAAGVWVATVPDGRFVYANRAFEEIMGTGGLSEVAAGQYAEPYGIYGRDGNLYPESRLPFVRALEARATAIVDDIVIHRSDGRRIFVRASAKPMFDGAGEMTHIAIAFFDITREVTAELARASAEMRLGRVVGNAPVVLFAFDIDGVFTLVEGRGVERVVSSPNELLGRSVFELYAGLPVIVANIRRALAGETVSYVADLGEAVFDTWLSPMRDDAGAVIGATGVATDVTDRHRAEVSLAQAERLASVGMLAAGVAHEINNPLSYVLGSLDVLARELPRMVAAPLNESARVAEVAVRDARQGAERVVAIVRDLKLFSRVQDHEATAVDVRASIESALGLAQNEIRHRARLVLDLAPVPVVWADAGRLGQLFLNLFINAAQSIGEGSANDNEIRISTRVDESGWVRIEVKDSGAGIPSETLPKIFDAFFTTKEVGVGTGLGLSIVHAIVTAAGGRIDVDSTLGKGSTFRVLLPPAPEARTRPSKEPPPPVRACRRGTILVIDDEPLILKVVKSLLTIEHDVTCESRAVAALERIRRGERFDAILCDLMMPDMTGMDVYDGVVAIAPDQAEAMLFLTGGAFTPRAQEFLDRVPNKAIEKPFDVTTLTARVRQMVG
jgi:PAS domain S-box-containing protein